jgi:methanethiol S-methyltransferase
MTELAALSDRDLKDLGMHRSHILWVASHGRHDPLASLIGKGGPDLRPIPISARPHATRAPPRAREGGGAPPDGAVPQGGVPSRLIPPPQPIDGRGGLAVTGQSEAMSDRKASLPERIAGFLFGAVAYLVFGGTFLYAIGFVAGMVVPKDIDGGTVVPALEALLINVWLMSLFAVQHSVMARKPFKRWWTQFVPHTIERSVYVLFSSLVLILLFWQWRPMPAIVWQVADPTAAMALMALSFAGWLLVLSSTFLINHFELFGLHQVIINLAGRKMPEQRFRTPLFYKVVRHPLYLGFIVAFWATPVMTVGHLLFAAVTTAYIFVGIFLEERDLVAQFGEQYKRYRAQVGMIIPYRRKAS